MILRFIRIKLLPLFLQLISLYIRILKMKPKQQTLTKTSQKLRKQTLQQELKEIIDQIKQTYFQFLSSLKFENVADKQSYKETIKSYRTHDKQNFSSIYDVDHQIYHQKNGYHDIHRSNGQSISELELKTFSFQEELSVENKGYMAFIRLISNIKQLQDYNHFLRSIVMSSDNQKHLENFEFELLEDLKKLQSQIPCLYFGKKN